ncbi:hypothetical protein Tcan_17527 [Toxocara canis]|uniref:Uncharacterized protein n=1 Tax=Toxocara canis TaxID=6265 RepID=A0A0B2UWY6_TOXCA|nr:hypothetical protein Tcan_17527 [Toxocara canis]
MALFSMTVPAFAIAFGLLMILETNAVSPFLPGDGASPNYEHSRVKRQWGYGLGGMGGWGWGGGGWGGGYGGGMNNNYGGVDIGQLNDYNLNL